MTLINTLSPKKALKTFAYSLCLFSLSSYQVLAQETELNNKSTNALASTTQLSVIGTVTNKQNLPVSGAKVTLSHTNLVAITDANGQFNLLLNRSSNRQGNALADHIELHVSAEKYSHVSKEVHFADATQTATVEMNFSLTPSVMEVIDIHATPLHSSSIESALPVSVLTSDDLRLKQSSTLGDTLKYEVGVHATSYGGVASSPIIRGLDGARVLITQNGLDVGDVSRGGADHAIAAESSTATQIEVLRGPATLFYGSGAIGGVVNVVDNRVPDLSLQNAGFEADYFIKHSTVNNENDASFSFNYGQDNYAIHADTFSRKSDDYELAEAIAGETEEEHDEHGEDEAHEDHEGEITTLENSNSQSSGYTLGGSYFFSNGFAGVSFGQLTKEYGIPFHSHDHEEEEHDDHEEEHEEEELHLEENVTGKLDQQRIQFISEFSPNSPYLNKISTKLAHTSYTHQELEYQQVETELKNNSTEARVDVFHSALLGWDGALTLHHKSSEFTATGEEAFTPNSDTNTWAIALLEEKHYGDLLVQLGARVEHVSISAELADEDHGTVDIHDLDFTPISLSAGSVWDFKQGYNLGVSLSYAQRAPSASEVFSNGLHIGTNTYELGSYYQLEADGDEYEVVAGQAQNELETSSSLDLTFRKFDGDFGFVINGFYSEINNYYYQENTGLTDEDLHHHEEGEEHSDDEHLEDEHDDEAHEDHDDALAIYHYQQADVRLYGIETEFHYQATSQLKVSMLGDYIRAKLTSGENLPRIPPLRVTGELNYQASDFSSTLSVSHYATQNDTADLETSTDGYTMINANFNYYINGVGSDLVLFLKGENLSNETAYVHSSFIKEQAPLPGRSFSVGVRGSF